ncbi:MAG: hypothetical protein AB4290_00685 [Spirulina sp.]
MAQDPNLVFNYNPELVNFLVKVAQSVYIGNNEAKLSQMGTILEVVRDRIKNIPNGVGNDFDINQLLIANRKKLADDWKGYFGKTEPEEVYMGIIGNGRLSDKIFKQVTSNKHCILIAFRGSSNPFDSLGDWRKNLDAKSAPESIVGQGKIHNGFQDYFSQMSKTILDIVLPLLKQYEQNSNLPFVLITGHSLGGALATLTAIYLKSYWLGLAANKNKKPNDLPLIIHTFGSPRIGDKTFATEFNDVIGYKNPNLANYSSLRFVAKKDPVPTVPVNNSYHVDIGIPLDPTNVDLPDPSAGIANHYISNYVNIIEKYIEKSERFSPIKSEVTGEAQALSLSSAYQDDRFDPSLRQSLSDSPITLNGEKVIFDLAVPTTPVALEPKGDPRKSNGNDYRPY